MVEFEYDERKSASNRIKHGIDFAEAVALWDDPDALIVPANIIGGERRWALIGEQEGKCFVAIYTMRQGKIRIISVRRCRKKEKAHYEENHS